MDQLSTCHYQLYPEIHNMMKKSSVLFTRVTGKDGNVSKNRKTNNQVNVKDTSAYQKASSELNQLAKESARVLLDIVAVFPFNFFPDEVIIDEAKVSIHTHYFFYTKQVRSIEYKDIFNVIVQQGIFFAKLELVDRFYAKESIDIEFLKKNDAIKARRIIQGMIIASKEGIDTHAIPIDELMKTLDRIGQSR